MLFIVGHFSSRAGSNDASDAFKPNRWQIIERSVRKKNRRKEKKKEQENMSLRRRILRSINSQFHFGRFELARGLRRENSFKRFGVITFLRSCVWRTHFYTFTGNFARNYVKCTSKIYNVQILHNKKCVLVF